MHKLIPLQAFLNRVAPNVNPSIYQPSGTPLLQTADTSANFGQWGSGWGQQGYFWMPYAYYQQYTDVGYVLLKPSSPIAFKPWPSPQPKPKPTPPSYYELTVGPADVDTVSKIETFCSGLHVGVVRRAVH